ncbi:cutinase family protein [Rhodococcus sp. NPDC058505]|uniref:cutinase family protein n=1 Tax=unclassified Rhodococcus (in: high G+C Gram-positive bacteria) TaxID=192944 RepID=UPI0036545B30
MSAARKSRSRLLRTLVALIVVLLVALVALVAWYLLAGRVPKPPVTPPGPERPSAQPASCPDVQVVAIPGTWESSAADDPFAPTANPNSLMLNITRPLQAEFDPQRVQVYTVPYVAQFSNPVALPPDGQMSYNKSRGEGTAKATDVLAAMHAECPLTSFVLTGFSQGAVIAGDLAASIGAGTGPVPADLVLGVGLIADGRRDPAAGVTVGPPVAGVGAELSLAGIKLPGITMTGARPGGFGALNDRAVQICAPTDGICDAPSEAFKPGNWMGSLSRLLEYVNNPVHALYNSFVVDGNGTTATQWMTNWAAEKVRTAPTPAHE